MWRNLPHFLKKLALINNKPVQPQHYNKDGNKMRTIRTKVYQFSELSKPAQEKAIIEQINFEIEMIEDEHNAFWDAAQEMERMQTPWFLAERIYHDPKLKAIIIKDIEANEYNYTADGRIFHATNTNPKGK